MGMTYDQGNQLISELWNFKVEFAQRMDALLEKMGTEIPELPNEEELLESISAIPLYDLGVLFGVLVGAVCVCIWAVTFKV